MSKNKRVLYGRSNFEYFNIYHNGIIPYLNIPGPYYNINLNQNTYERLKEFGVELYPVWDDPILKERKRKYAEKKAKEDLEKKKVLEELKAAEELQKALESMEPTVLKTEEDKEIIIEDYEPIEVVVTPLGEVIRKEELPPKEENEEEFKSKIKSYTLEELEEKTNKELAFILREERGYNGKYDPLAPKYHDTKKKLIDKIIKTQ